MSELWHQSLGLQETCERARRKISENTAEYKKSLRDFVPLPVERFTYELDTFSQISHYLNIPDIA